MHQPRETPRVPNGPASPPFRSTPPQSLIVMTNPWKYNQIDNLDGVNWTDPAYNDSALNWSNASPAVFYHSLTPQSITGGPLNTVLALTNGATGGVGNPTFYFPQHFQPSAGLLCISPSPE